jgi:DNA processing protein
VTPLPHEAHLAAMAGLDLVGPATLRRLAALGDPVETWDHLRNGRLPVSVCAARTEPPRTQIDRWAAQARTIDPADVWTRLRRIGVGVVSLGGPGYPEALRSDPDPPVLLFTLGDPATLDQPCVAVVGTRGATAYGRGVAHDLGRDLAANGVCVVSGLALGIDAAAHAGACRGGAGPAAVVGAGPDRPCPRPNLPLARRVATLGLLCSELPPGVGAQPWRFPVRNRIVAGLSQVVVVVESAATGGSMSTVEHAILRNRTVLAVPGPVDAPTSAGCNALLADGAVVCSGVDDVLAALGGAVRPAGPLPDHRMAPTGAAAAVLDLLGWRPESVEYLVVASGLPIRSLVGELERLERAGWVVRRDGFVERLGTSGRAGDLGATP